MTFWESNSAIVNKRYPGLLEEICGQPDLEPGDFQIETAAAGDPTLKIRDVYVHSPRDPAREGRRLAESLNTAGTGGPVVILGFALGYAAQAACELWPERPLIIVEKYRSLLRLALEVRDLRILLERNNVIFVPGGSGEGITGALSLFAEQAGAAEKTVPAVMRNRALAGLDEQWYAAVEGRIRTWSMRDDVNAATLKRFGKRWVRNLSRNMTCIRDLPGISRFSGLAAGAEMLPVFLAAAGPGLDQAGSLLPAIQRRCIVVAVDTSLRFLLKHGISPDFTVTVDPQFWNSRHLDRCAPEQTRLVAESAVYPPVLRLPFKELYLCGSLFPLGSFIEQRVDPKGELGAGGSVATTAWDFARALGSREIWIAGLDLAFPLLKTHFRGAAFEEKSLSQSSRHSPAETWIVRALRDGQPFRAPAKDGQVLTDRRLSLYAAWFENRFRRYPDVRNYSLSAGGLAIAGLENAGPDALLKLPERRDEINRRLASAVTRIKNDFFDPEETRARATRYENAVSVLLRGLEQVKASAEEGASIAEQTLRCDMPAAGQDAILKKLDAITRSIAGSEVKEVAGFLFPPSEVSETNISARDHFRAYLESSLRLCRALAEAVKFNLDEMEPVSKSG